MSDKPDKRVRSPSYQPLQEARKLLRRKMVRTHEGVEFIPQPEIKRFWLSTWPLKEFFRDLRCEVSQDKCHKIKTTHCRIFTALVFVEWDFDYRFRQIFREVFPDDVDPVWTDEFLISGGDFQRSVSPHLSSDEAKALDSTRILLSVSVLDMRKDKPYPGHIPLPFTTKTEIGKGAYGKVYRITIAAGCLQVENSNGGESPNEAEQPFALKEMMEASESRGELEFLREYRNNSRKSDFIAAHLAIIERNDQASVIYPLAAGDLQKLLEGKLEQDAEQFRDTVKRYQWREKDAEQFGDIVRKSCNLADGLEFLHTHMHNYSRLVCRHGDLKPNNFLIFPTGWKISDMGLARVKSTSNEEEGVRKTTKTSLKDGCGPYAAPEMSGPEGTLIGRETDVWSLAAIIMELIIWGFGGPVAWTDFAGHREKSSKGLFHDNGALSKVVDDELRSWPEVHSEKMSAFFRGNDEQASKVLKDMVKALRGAFEIDPSERAKATDLLKSMEQVLNHFKSPVEVEQEIATLKTREIRTSSSTTAFSVLQRKFKEHRQHKIFNRNNFKPKEQICVSNETESELRKWLRQPTSSALCILQEGATQWLQVSAITHEVYYTARRNHYQVVEFLTLDRYGRTFTSLQVSLDFVHFVIWQLLKEPQEHDLDGLAIEDSTLPDEVKFEAAVNVLGKTIKALGQDRKSKPIIVIVDEFWHICPRIATDATKEQWKSLLALLGCAGTKVNRKTNAYPSLVAPHFRVLIRASGWFSDLQNLGFSGASCTPSSAKYSVPSLRRVLNDLFKNSA